MHEYVGVLTASVDLTAAVDLAPDVQLRPLNEAEKTALPNYDWAWVISLLHPNINIEIGDDEIERARSLLVSTHILLRLLQAGGITIPVERLYAHDPDEEQTYTEDVSFVLPYRKPWAEWHYSIGEDRLPGLKRLFTTDWQVLCKNPLFSRFAEAVHRYSELDRWVDFCICLEGCLVPDGGEGEVRNKFSHRAALFFEREVDGDRSKAFKAFGAWYDLRSAILHGQNPLDSRYNNLWNKLDATQQVDRHDWKRLRLLGDEFARKALSFNLFQLMDKTQEDRIRFWQESVLRGDLLIS